VPAYVTTDTVVSVPPHPWSGPLRARVQPQRLEATARGGEFTHEAWVEFLASHDQYATPEKPRPQAAAERISGIYV